MYYITLFYILFPQRGGVNDNMIKHTVHHLPFPQRDCINYNKNKHAAHVLSVIVIKHEYIYNCF